MTMMTTRTYGDLHIGSSLRLTEEQLQQLVGLFKLAPQKASAPLGGRSSVSVHQIDGLGPVVLKHYTRGGLLHHVVKHRYLKLGRTRCQLEYDLLLKIRELGINAPEPVARAYRGRLFYLAWLVTREIPKPLSLARLSLQDEGKARAAMHSAIGQISVLVEHHILHVDLHPGNVVVDGGGTVYLLDFDKGHVYRGSREQLKDRYISRWRRAVVKHRLPDFLAEMMQEGLN